MRKRPGDSQSLIWHVYSLKTGEKKSFARIIINLFYPWKHVENKSLGTRNNCQDHFKGFLFYLWERWINTFWQVFFLPLCQVVRHDISEKHLEGISSKQNVCIFFSESLSYKKTTTRLVKRSLWLHLTYFWPLLNSLYNNYDNIYTLNWITWWHKYNLVV